MHSCFTLLPSRKLAILQVFNKFILVYGIALFVKALCNFYLFSYITNYGSKFELGAKISLQLIHKKILKPSLFPC
jgi:hypothetical protein